jgi:hypothetical protein
LAPRFKERFRIRHMRVRILPPQPTSAVSPGHIRIGGKRPTLPRFKKPALVSAAKIVIFSCHNSANLGRGLRPQIFNIRIFRSETRLASAETGSTFLPLRAKRTSQPTVVTSPVDPTTKSAKLQTRVWSASVLFENGMLFLIVFNERGSTVSARSIYLGHRSSRSACWVEFCG